VEAPNNISHQSCLMTRRDGQCGEQPRQPQMQPAHRPPCASVPRDPVRPKPALDWRDLEAACSPYRTQDRALEKFCRV
jgi:hypothetical protein